MKRKIFYIIFIIVLLNIFGCGSNQKQDNEKILKQISAMIPDDRFYFVRGLERERSLSTNIRYRGIVYSDKLREAKAFSGIEIALEDIDQRLNSWFIKNAYESGLYRKKAEEPLRINAKKIFGNDITVHSSFPMVLNLKEYVEYINKYKGKKIKELEKQTPTMYITAFTEDLTELKEADIDNYKKKIFELHQILYNTYNINASINLTLRNREDLTYKLIAPNIFNLVRDEPKVKSLLDKWKTTGSLKANEIGYLTDYMVSKPSLKNNIGIVFTKFKSRKTSSPDEIDVYIREKLLALMKHMNNTKDRRR